MSLANLTHKAESSQAKITKEAALKPWWIPPCQVRSPLKCMIEISLVASRCSSRWLGNLEAILQPRVWIRLLITPCRSTMQMSISRTVFQVAISLTSGKLYLKSLWWTKPTTLSQQTPPTCSLYTLSTYLLKISKLSRWEEWTRSKWQIIEIYSPSISYSHRTTRGWLRCSSSSQHSRWITWTSSSSL